jgi:hypothetical protein
MPLQGLTEYKTRQGEEKDELWPGVSTRRRDGAARWLGAAWLTARWRSSRWRGCMGAPRCLARTHTKLARPKPSKGWGFSPLPGRARRLGHGGTQVGVHCGGKEQGGSRPAASKGAHLDGGGIAQATLKAPPLCDNPPRKIPYYHLKPILFGH